MAAAVSTIQPSRQDLTVAPNLSPNLHLNFLQHGLAIPDLDFKDNRYPSLTLNGKPTNRTPSMILTSGDSTHARDSPNLAPSDNQRHPSTSADQLGPQRKHEPTDRRTLNDKKHDPSHPSDPNGPPHSSMASHGLPPGTTRPVFERYNLDDNNHTNGNTTPLLNGGNMVDSKLFNDSFKSFGESSTQPPPSPPLPTVVSAVRNVPSSLLPANHRQPSYPAPDGAGVSRLSPLNGLASSKPYSPTVGLPIHISSNTRAYPQHPTYITPSGATPDPINPILSPNPPQPQEEVCVECAMRDQDMADVVVVGPGLWDRESDVLYEELLRREEDDEAAGILPAEFSTRPRARGGRLTEQNLKVWATMTPREPASRQQTVDAYVKAQRSLLEAEALAHARAMQESIQLENSVRDTYSQLRRSTYDLGVVDDNAFKLRPPRTASTALTGGAHHIRGSSRDITLLDNGLIVEHVDVWREEREERERRRRQEKRSRSRPRKCSRGSAVDVTSLYSSHSLAPHTDSGLGLMQSSRYSAISTRPTSSLTVPIDRQPSLGQVYSQASFSDAHSPGSASPRRSRFFGFKNPSSAWRSQDSLTPSGVSGSMIDMHVALQREANGPRLRSPVGQRSTLSTQRHSQLWPPAGSETEPTTAVDEKPKKKRNGFAKIWKLVKGGSLHKDDAQVVSRDSTQSLDRNDDDLPLAPPPPLSYLVERGPGEHLGSAGGRHSSTPSLPSTTSPRNGGLSSPGGNGDGNDRKNSGQTDEKEKLQQAMFASTNGMTLPKSVGSRPQGVLSREKSLPPLPGDVKLRHQNGLGGESRPQTLYTYDPRHGAQGMQELVPPHPPFRTEARRQSFGGTGSRPNLGIQTVPLLGVHDHLKAPNGMYSEFGVSRRSLGRLGDIEENPAAAPTPTKRKSKFGFASLLGKKSSTPPETHTNSHEFPRLTSPVFDGNDDNLTFAYTNSISRQGAGPRLSVASRKAIEERVEQDREFVAYRYPSQAQSPIGVIR
ncbi:hypothetical protein PAXRUDRAFT_254525 [Paxillus rubicundulus Ve08.2h10]|uniref:Uncharacterized protein n=1 Tax=Paxillus rubicundulus Ve08.2h10 TaxID=930991 RepID=A0A0D0DTE6_9AGAM|nr:hypothetical protein PAXRUDRAFT_254525 [Paxillus rubicundulus Ve08.2h10]